MNRALRLVLLAALGLSACDKREPPAGENPPAPPATTPAEPTKPVPVPDTPPPIADATDPSTEEDFEAESAREITKDTLDAQLDALEKEILAE